MPSDLEKSHSKVSNAKLTLICLGLSLFFGSFWAGLIVTRFLEPSISFIGYIISGASLLLVFLFMHLVSKFTR